MTTKVTRKSNYDKIAKKISEISSKKTKVGWFESSVYEDGTPAAVVAMANEFGRPSVPARSFMRTTAAEKNSEWRSDFGELIKLSISGEKTINSCYDAIGSIASGDIRKKISEITTPPLAASTIEMRKKKNKIATFDQFFH